MPQKVYAKERHRKKDKKLAAPFAKVSLHCPCCNQERSVSKAKTLFLLEQSLREKGIQIYPNDEEGWTIRRASKGCITWACEDCLKSGKAIAAKPWLQSISIAVPTFAYIDSIYSCEDCNEDFIFSAKEQQFWYEKLQFGTFAYPKQCAKCRRKRRIFKRDFHNVQRALAALQPDSSEQLANIAELYLKIGNIHKALEFMRRAKNKSQDPLVREQFEQRIKATENEFKPLTP